MSLGIMEAALNLFKHHCTMYGIGGFQEESQLGLHYAERRQFLGQPMQVFPTRPTRIFPVIEPNK